jgi:hypothetical protein
MFKTGHPKLGGRKCGTKNKKTLLAADELLLKLDINPVEKLIYIAESDGASIKQQIRCWQEIAKHTYPKLKSQEIYIEPEPGMPTVIEIVAYGEDKVDEDKT